MGPFPTKAEAKATLEAEGYTWVDHPYGRPWRVDGMTLVEVFLSNHHGRIHAGLARITFPQGSFGESAMKKYIAAMPKVASPRNKVSQHQ
jgi:hypothetical protein